MQPMNSMIESDVFVLFLFRWRVFAGGTSDRCSWNSEFDTENYVRSMAWSYLWTKNQIQVFGHFWHLKLTKSFILKPLCSREGALNLLRDFDGVSEWIRTCKYVRPEHVEILAKHEVLRTCEGVGKILLRKPFEVILMTEQSSSCTPRANQKTSGNILQYLR